MDCEEYFPDRDEKDRATFASIRDLRLSNKKTSSEEDESLPKQGADDEHHPDPEHREYRQKHAPLNQLVPTQHTPALLDSRSDHRRLQTDVLLLWVKLICDLDVATDRQVVSRCVSHRRCPSPRRWAQPWIHAFRSPTIIRRTVRTFFTRHVAPPSATEYAQNPVLSTLGLHPGNHSREEKDLREQKTPKN